MYGRVVSVWRGSQCMEVGQCMEGWSVYGGVVSVWRGNQCMELGQCIEVGQCMKG